MASWNKTGKNRDGTSINRHPSYPLSEESVRKIATTSKDWAAFDPYDPHYGEEQHDFTQSIRRWNTAGGNRESPERQPQPGQGLQQRNRPQRASNSTPNPLNQVVLTGHDIPNPNPLQRQQLAQVQNDAPPQQETRPLQDVQPKPQSEPTLNNKQPLQFRPGIEYTPQPSANSSPAVPQLQNHMLLAQALTPPSFSPPGAMIYPPGIAQQNPQLLHQRHPNMPQAPGLPSVIPPVSGYSHYGVPVFSSPLHGHPIPPLYNYGFAWPSLPNYQQPGWMPQHSNGWQDQVGRGRDRRRRGNMPNSSPRRSGQMEAPRPTQFPIRATRAAAGAPTAEEWRNGNQVVETLRQSAFGTRRQRHVEQVSPSGDEASPADASLDPIWDVD